MRRADLASSIAVAVLLIAAPRARAQEPIPYGSPIQLEPALKLVAAAELEAKKNHWSVAVTIVNSGGHLVALHRQDNTQLGSIQVSMEKAKTSVLYRRPTKYFEDLLAQGEVGLRSLATGAMPVDGGLPIIQDGKIIGAIGVSGARPVEDAQVARAGLAALEAAAKP